MITTAEHLLGWLVTTLRHGIEPEECLIHSDSYSPNPGQTGPCPPAVFVQLLANPLLRWPVSMARGMAAWKLRPIALSATAAALLLGWGCPVALFLANRKKQKHNNHYSMGNRWALTKLSIPNAKSWDDFQSLGIGQQDTTMGMTWHIQECLWILHHVSSGFICAISLHKQLQCQSAGELDAQTMLATHQTELIVFFDCDFIPIKHVYLKAWLD